MGNREKYVWIDMLRTDFKDFEGNQKVGKAARYMISVCILILPNF